MSFLVRTDGRSEAPRSEVALLQHRLLRWSCFCALKPGRRELRLEARHLRTASDLGASVPSHSTTRDRRQMPLVGAWMCRCMEAELILHSGRHYRGSTYSSIQFGLAQVKLLRPPSRCKATFPCGLDPEHRDIYIARRLDDRVLSCS